MISWLGDHSILAPDTHSPISQDPEFAKSTQELSQSFGQHVRKWQSTRATSMPNQP